MFVVRVRRRADQEPLEKVMLQFDTTTNQLKRKKLVTQSEHLVNQFNK